MSRGGSRPGAGRPKGAGNKLDAEMLESAKKLGLEIVPGTSLHVLNMAYTGRLRNTPGSRLRVEAARAAAAYEYPRLTDNVNRDAPMTDAQEAEMLASVNPKVVASLLTGMVASNPDAKPQLVAWAIEHLGLIEKPASELQATAGGNVLPLVRH